ncbi:MAG TPA: hypothetical protein VD927_01935 [Chryseosolibacter sp.]|nr:hypothetical protein [Chryseosolibacter sp.]
MKVLYPREAESLTTKEIRRNKRDFLNRFKSDGFYLIDSLDEPFERKYSISEKIVLLKNGQKRLLEKMKYLLAEETHVILIASSVYRANFEFLKQQGIPLVNKEPIDFPGSGGQKKFREKMKNILK